MNLLNNPEWLSKYQFPYNDLSDMPQAAFDAINTALDSLPKGEPVVSIIISAWNEEVSILKTIASIAHSVSFYPLEIIVVNNNSTDRTQEVLDKLHIRSCFQLIQGWGPARQMGLEQASGKYVLLADADCIYPSSWVNHMMQSLSRTGVVCVYGRYSFIAEPGFPRWKLSLLERLKDAVAAVRQIKRPYLNAYGMSMGFKREDALRIGFVMHRIRGEDGRMCYDLMQNGGRVVPVTAAAARVWTGPRTLQRDGSFGKALWLRFVKEVRGAASLFRSLPAHDTKTSLND
jgi:glycosyltransferase involved in cell wall biosynthesis